MGSINRAASMIFSRALLLSGESPEISAVISVGANRAILCLSVISAVAVLCVSLPLTTIVSNDIAAKMQKIFNDFI
jgi:hypothetical protein